MTDVTPSKSDRAGLAVFSVFATVGAGFVVAAVVGRLAEVLPGRDIPVTLPVEGESVALPFGPGGSAVDATIDTATVIVPQVAPATMVALVAEPLLLGLATVAGIVLFVLFSLNLIRGRAFSRGNVRVLWWGTAAATVATVSQWLFGNMIVNGAYSALSDYGYDGARAELQFGIYGVVVALAAVSTAFQIGHRLQRETEGLV